MTCADDVITYLKGQGEGEPYGLLVRQVSLTTRYDGGQYVLVRDLADAREPESCSKTSFHTVGITVSMGPGEEGLGLASSASEEIWRKLELVQNVTIGASHYQLITNKTSPNESQTGNITTYSWDLNIIKYYGD
jgi:hypothetical protein